MYESTEYGAENIYCQAVTQKFRRTLQLASDIPGVGRNVAVGLMHNLS
jgi:hypothetical protein